MSQLLNIVIFAGKDWISWAALGLKVKDEKHQLRWRNCTDIPHAWTGLVILKPGQAEPLHKHTTPMFYYILQVSSQSSTITPTDPSRHCALIG